VLKTDNFCEKFSLKIPVVEKTATNPLVFCAFCRFFGGAKKVAHIFLKKT
jgi:hypothetical protein